jgi:glycosyltransferase involved in cell wall biosynthesis
MRQDVERFYKSSDLFVSSSDIEGLSIAYLEALSCGLPLVATKTAGTDELIRNGENGYFIEPATAEQAAATIERALAVDLSMLRRNALAYIQEFDILNSAGRYEALLAAAARY